MIAPSALKHGLSETKILHAYRNPIRVWDLGDGFTMMLGANQAAIILEIGHVQEGDSQLSLCRNAGPFERFLR